MPTLVPVGAFSVSDIMIGASILFGVAMTVDLLVILLVGQVKEALSNINFVQRINLFTSIGFLLIGLFLLYSAFFMSSFSFDLL